MSLRNSLNRLVNVVARREHDQGRVARVFAEFDQRRGYAAYQASCQAAFRRGPVPADDSLLSSRGFDYLKVCGADQAAAVRGELLDNYRISRLKKDSPELEGFRITEPARIEGLLGSIFTGPLDRVLTRYYQSEYLAHWVACSLTPQAEMQESVSFRWHCDKGPTCHLKIIVYLNATQEHGGNTEFIDLEDTTAVACRGYVFGWSKTRTASVDHLARLAGRPIATHLHPLAAGDAVLFQPARVLHRGVSPTRGPRIVVTICLLPSPLHWRTAYQMGTMSDLAEDAKWHDDAMQLLAAMRVPSLG